MGLLLDPSLMRTLLVVAEEGSFTRVGERLGLTQQAISAQIKRLEMSFGRQLVDRGGQGVRLTADGEALLAYARQLTAISDNVRRHFSAVPVRGSVRVGILEGFASTGLPSVLAAMRAVQPNLDITVQAASTDRLLAGMDHGRLDMVLGLQRHRAARGEVLWTDRIRWFGDVSPYADPAVPVRLVAAPEPSLPRTLAIEALTGAGRPYAVLFESESRISLRAAALAGLGIAAFCDSFHDGEASDPPPGMPALPLVEFFLKIVDTDNEAVGLFADVLRKFGKDVVGNHGSRQI